MEWINFEKIIEKEMRTSTKKRQKDTLFASEIGYCMRKTYYNIFTPKEYPAEMLKIFVVGDLIHEKLSEFMSRTKHKIKSEQDVVVYVTEGDFRISGRYDDLVYDDDDKILIEKKSTSQIQYYTSPSWHHLLQAHIYMAATGAKKCQILYIEKNSFKCKSFNIEYDESIFKHAIERSKILMDLIRKKQLPIPEAKNVKDMTWQCKYCPYKDDCNSDTNI